MSAADRGDLRGAAEAWRALRRREEVRAAASAAEETGVAARIVGGAVRDAFLRRPHGDLDVSVPPGRGRAFWEALARRLGARPVEIGAAGKRIVRIPWHRREVDVWEEESEDRDADVMRRDFRVNAMAFELPGGRFVAPEGALEDLRRRRLAPPRAGVFVEDPLRVLRAVRLELALSFRVDPRALPELRRAAALLPRVAAERTNAEMELLLAAAPKDAARALGTLERWGALARLLPGTSARERRRGIRLVARAGQPDAALARILLVAPLGSERALAALESWKVSRITLRAARTLLALPSSRPDRVPTRREVVLFLRACAPFTKQASAFLLGAGDAGSRLLARAAAEAAPTPARLRCFLSPRRPIPAEEVARSLGIPHGPALGAALSELDVAVAAGEVRGAAGARKLLASLKSGLAGATLMRSPKTRKRS